MGTFCCAEEIEGRKNMRKINITTGFINDKSAFCKRRRYAPASNDSLCCHETLKEQLYSTFSKRTESNEKKIKQQLNACSANAISQSYLNDNCWLCVYCLDPWEYILECNSCWQCWRCVCHASIVFVLGLSVSCNICIQYSEIKCIQHRLDHLKLQNHFIAMLKSLGHSCDVITRRS